jgi:hypothetical protein
MRKTSLHLALFATMFVPMMQAAPAQAAGATRSFVAILGNDSNACTNTAPCRTLAAAYAVTQAGGEIDIADPAGYGALTITHAISIQGHGYAGVSVTSGTAITISAGPTDAINLRGLLFDGVGTGNVGLQFNTGGSLNIQDSEIRNFNQGIIFNPSGSSTLTMSNTIVADIGAATGGTGLEIGPTGSGTVTCALDHVSLVNNGNSSNGFGAYITGYDTTGTLTVTFSNGVISNNPSVGMAVLALAGHATTKVLVADTVVSNNIGTALYIFGGPSTLYVARSKIMGNGTGWGVIGGSLISSGDNFLAGNGTDGTATSTITLH